MSECGDDLLRDQLPEYLHGRLGAGDVVHLTTHLERCEECRMELAALRSIRQALDAPAPAIDVASIVRALPRPPRHAAPRRVLWRAAAAIGFIAIGGVSLSVARGRLDGTSAVRAAARPPVADSPVLAMADGTGAGLGVGGDFGELASQDIETLLGVLESVEAAPSADPEDRVLTPGAAAGAVK